MTYRTRVIVSLCVAGAGLLLFLGAGVALLAVYGSLEDVLVALLVTGAVVCALALIGTVP